MRVFRIPIARSSRFCIAVLLATATAGFASAHAAHLPRAANRAPSAPKAVVPFTNYTFGDVYTGEIISQIFVIKNEGDADLLVKDFKGDCGCTVARSDRVIKPGQEGTADIEVQTISQSGLIYKTATLHTNDPARPTILFTIVANVVNGPPQRQGKYVGPIFLSPGSQVAMYAVPGKIATTELLINAVSPVKVLRAECGTKNFTARVEVVEAGKSYKILVESLPIDTGGMYKDQVRIVTDNPTLPAFNVDVALRVYSTQ